MGDVLASGIETGTGTGKGMPLARAAAYEHLWGDWDMLGMAKWAIMDSNCLLMLSSCKLSGQSCRDMHADVTRSHARSRMSTEITIVFAD